MDAEKRAEKHAGVGSIISSSQQRSMNVINLDDGRNVEMLIIEMYNHYAGIRKFLIIFPTILHPVTDVVTHIPAIATQRNED